MVQRDPRPYGHEYDEWRVADDRYGRLRYVGQLASGTAAFYYPESDVVVEGRVDEEEREIVPDLETERSARGKLGELVEEIGDEVGWESLSEFVEEHVEGDRGNEES